MKRNDSSLPTRAGSILVITMVMLAVLALIGATVLRTVVTRYDYTQKSIGWEKALDTAEAGADYGLANCRWNVTGGSAPWSGWKKYDASTQAQFVDMGSVNAHSIGSLTIKGNPAVGAISGNDFLGNIDVAISIGKILGPPQWEAAPARSTATSTQSARSDRSTYSMTPMELLEF